MQLSLSDAQSYISQTSPHILIISKDGCGPCIRLKSQLDELRSYGVPIDIFQIDMSNDLDLDWLIDHHIDKFPTLLFVKNGSIQDKFIGANIEAIGRWIQTNIDPIEITDDF